MKEKINWEEFSKEAAEHIRQGKPLTGEGGIFSPLIKQVLEAALEGELDSHLNDTRGSSGNRRNGRTPKKLKSSIGNIEVFTPRDRNGSFEPVTVEKRQTVLPGDLDEKIMGLYGLGMSYKDIQTHLSEMYGLSISDGVINSITDRVIPAIREWQCRPLERLYAIVWMDAIHFKIREDGKVITKAVYSVLGVNMQGQKEVLGLYLGHNESATFWLQVLNDLNQRGVEDILIASIDNLNGFAEAIENIFPKSEVQLCVIHQIRNSMKYIPWKNYREFMKDLKKVYQAGTLELAEYYLDELDQKWGEKYPVVIKSWRSNWTRLSNYFKYPEQIRRLIYTTNTVEGYHRMVRKVTKSKGAFTSDNAMLKLVYLATLNFQKRWVNNLRDWPMIINQLFTFFDERIKTSDTVH
ncbi:MAG: IS256 family transposase [Bacteroidales bacterium]|nr:IS256 family transposase [Bacteroidales bacterium]